jgi:hypothetical protein
MSLDHHAKLLRIAETDASKARISARVGAEAWLNLICIRLKAEARCKVRNEPIKVQRLSAGLQSVSFAWAQARSLRLSEPQEIP